MCQGRAVSSRGEREGHGLAGTVQRQLAVVANKHTVCELSVPLPTPPPHSNHPRRIALAPLTTTPTQPNVQHNSPTTSSPPPPPHPPPHPHPPPAASWT
jgi:hypothetical protein